MHCMTASWYRLHSKISISSVPCSLIKSPSTRPMSESTDRILTEQLHPWPRNRDHEAAPEEHRFCIGQEHSHGHGHGHSHSHSHLGPHCWRGICLGYPNALL